MTRVLVVDDNETNRYYLHSLLQANGYDVSLAGDGRQALALAHEQPPALVVSDLLMPVMDGYSLLREWKNDADLQRIPFVVYTATYTEPEDEALARDLGADDFLLKPTESALLLQRLRQVLQQPARQVSLDPHQSEHARQHDRDIFQSYSQTLVRKLEERSRLLEQANRTLERDIARRKEAEAALRRSEERFRLVAQATTDAAWDLDLQSGLRWWGEGVARVFGHVVPSGENGDREWKSWIHPDDRDDVIRSRAHAMRRGGAWLCTYRLQRGTGNWAHVEDRGHVLLNDRGQAVRMVGGLNDITEKVALQEQLGRSQRLEAVGQLTGGVAHDFNNLLTVVLGNAQVLSELLADRPDVQSVIALITRAADRGAQLTRQLLAFASRQMLSPRPVHLHALVKDMLPLLQSAAGSGVTLSFQGNEELPVVEIDAVQLESALVNLVVNARDAMNGVGDIRLVLKKHAVENGVESFGQTIRPGDYVAIQVADTGPGIAPEHLNHIFEPFYTTKAVGAGSGLGLPMVYGFMRQSGGFVLVGAAPEQGAQFILGFPAARDSTQLAPALVPPVEVQRGKGEIILVVEDDEPVRDVVRGQLESLGYQVIPAGSAHAALDCLGSGRTVHLLLTDMLMAGTTGLELATQARRLRPGLPVLYSTGYQGHVDVELLKDARASVLQKPYRRDELAREVRYLLDTA